MNFSLPRYLSLFLHRRATRHSINFMDGDRGAGDGIGGERGRGGGPAEGGPRRCRKALLTHSFHFLQTYHFFRYLPATFLVIGLPLLSLLTCDFSVHSPLYSITDLPLLSLLTLLVKVRFIPKIPQQKFD